VLSFRADPKVGRLARFGPLRHLSRRALVRLAALGDVVAVSPGTVLEQGVAGACLLLTGSVLVSNSSGVIGAAQPGQWLVDCAGGAQTAIALASVIVLAFGPAERAAALAYVPTGHV
jgi:hypothetical protein